jgi:hypothetical protein
MSVVHLCEGMIFLAHSDLDRLWIWGGRTLFHAESPSPVHPYCLPFSDLLSTCAMHPARPHLLQWTGERWCMSNLWPTSQQSKTLEKGVQLELFLCDTSHRSAYSPSRSPPERARELLGMHGRRSLLCGWSWVQVHLFFLRCSSPSKTTSSCILGWSVSTFHRLHHRLMYLTGILSWRRSFDAFVSTWLIPTAAGSLLRE